VSYRVTGANDRFLERPFYNLCLHTPIGEIFRNIQLRKIHPVPWRDRRGELAEPSRDSIKCRIFVIDPSDAMRTSLHEIIEPVSAMPKRKLENSEQRPAPLTRPQRAEMPEIAGQRLRRTGLTRGDIGGSLQPGKISPETNQD
jgi:hypothetical protein